jgi:hypothetical protein
MAQTFVFNGQKVVLPGVYSDISGGNQSTPLVSATGNVLIIDTGLEPGAGGGSYGGGAGILGTMTQGKKSVYKFDNITDFRSFVKGGYWWLLADPLFNPDLGVDGVATIFYTRAATTTPATLTFSPKGGGYAGGTIVINTFDEGLIANGAQVLNGTNEVLSKGYAFTLSPGVVNTSKYILSFWQGTFKGIPPASINSDGLPYDGIAANMTNPLLVAKSIEFSGITDLLAWMQTDPNFNTYFIVQSSSITGTGLLASTDLVLYSGNTLAVGGTETFNTAGINAVLDAVTNLGYNFILSDQYGNNAAGVTNFMYLSHILNQAKFMKFLWVGGGFDSAHFNLNSLGQLVTYSSADSVYKLNSERVVVVHGGVQKNSNLTGVGYRVWDQLYKTAICLGRTCGLAPQVPSTFKTIAIDGEVHLLLPKEMEQSVEIGIFATYYDDDFQKFIILDDVNSLQLSQNDINPDGTSYIVQLTRISAALNNGFIVDGKKELFSNPSGTNRNTLSTAYIRDWTIGKLKSVTANPLVDNLILSFTQPVVTVVGTAYFVQYGFYPNEEVDQIFMTGFMLS